MSTVLRPGQILTLALITGIMGLPQTSQAQELSQDSVIVIGNSPAEWEFYSNYWQQLMNLSLPQTPSETSETRGFENKQAAPEKLAKKVVVSNLRQDFIIKLNGSSVISGQVTNRNLDPVIVQSVNFELRDGQGNLIQTGSSVPTPNLLAPGQTATFSETLLTAPVDRRNTLKLSRPGVIVQPVQAASNIE